jgi:cytochrome c2
MTANLRFVLAMLVCGALAVPLTMFVQHRQSVSDARTTAEQITGGDVDRGKQAISRYRCGSCHVIEGIGDANGQVGPALDGLAQRAELAGRLANNPTNLRRWVRAPQSINPGGGMPDLGVTEQAGRDIAAYLYTLKVHWFAR